MRKTDNASKIRTILKCVKYFSLPKEKHLQSIIDRIITK